MVDSSAVWKTNPDNSWRLYTNTDYKAPQVAQQKEEKSKETQSPGPKAKSQGPSAFSFTKTKPTTKGHVTCTSKGYGVIQSFNEEKGTVSVKIEGQVHELPQDDVLSDIPLTVVFLNDSMKMEQIFYLPITSTMNEVIERVESSMGQEGDSSSVSLYTKGKEVQGSTETLEKLKILPGTKFLGVMRQKNAVTLNRFPMVLSGWGISPGTVLAISFSVSKTIRVIGFGMYKPTYNTLSGTGSLYRGANINGQTAFASETITVNSTNQKGTGTIFGANEVAQIEKIMFNRPLLLKPGEHAAVAFMPTSACTTQYGNQGKQNCEGEGGVNFTFGPCPDAPFSSSYDSGQIPEIYYYL